MEKDATLNVDRKERCVSLPDCCRGSELRDIPGKPMGHISKEMDEDDSHEGEDQFVSLEASTETLVHVSDEDTDSDLYLTDDKQILTTQGPKMSDQHSIKGAGSLVKTLPIMESNQGSYDSWGMAGGAELVLVEEKGDRKVVDMVSKSLELCKDISLSEIKDASKMNACDSLNVKDIAPEKHLLNSAVIAQHRRKPDFPKDEHERNTCSAVQDEFLAIPCADRGLPLLETDSGSCLLQPPSCPSGMSAENGLEKSGFSEYQNRSLPKVNSGDGMQCLHIKETLATHEPTDNQVRLRKRKNSIATLRTPFCIPHLLLMQLFETKTVKQWRADYDIKTQACGNDRKYRVEGNDESEIREDRDRVRLDSMLLLIMKLDQLDQDIENALSTSSSPSSTPTNLRRQVPDLESGSESGADNTLVNQTQINLSSNTESTDLTSSTSVASSGTKPKSMNEQITWAIPGTSEKEKAGKSNSLLLTIDHDFFISLLRNSPSFQKKNTTTKYVINSCYLLCTYLAISEMLPLYYL
ncbi:hypothetical protein EI555_012696 [Monodon monoceros]|uniref:Rho GTPase-activating protein 7 n=1 Tax=Monodon monoceros TaxID=40151 RepID=A0A4U1EW17_MONMO|nr:hypothetical protein EI555_012696 [Monodon monoceros]